MMRSAPLTLDNAPSAWPLPAQLWTPILQQLTGATRADTQLCLHLQTMLRLTLALHRYQQSVVGGA